MSSSANKSENHSENIERRAKRLVLCLDGTWNSPYDVKEREDQHKVLKPSNTLKICRAVRPTNATTSQAQIAFYHNGIGSLAEYQGMANQLLHYIDHFLGGMWGAGFEGNVEDALHFLVLNFEAGDEIFIFGFSRGAATARAITHFLDWSGGLPKKEDAYYLPLLFRAYVDNHGTIKAQEVLEKINEDRQKQKKPLSPLKEFSPTIVKYLGVWDTVMALGSRFRSASASTSTHEKSFYLSETPAACVHHARQALAIDEARYDFRPEIWTKSRETQFLEQRWFAGAHSNVGGGYLHDGLANIAFHWVLDGAKDEGLDIDENYVNHYRSYHLDTMYDSSSAVYKIGDVLRFSVGRGERQLTGIPATANLYLDNSVIDRIREEPGTLRGKDDTKTMTPYRPENVLQLLACQPDLDEYLLNIGVKDLENKPLPDDVRISIGRLRINCANTK